MATKIINSGDVYGYLTIISEIENYISKGGKSNRQVSAICECGIIINRQVSKLSDKSSCGCKLHLFRDKKHGKYKSKEYCSWRCLKNRCYNHKNASYETHGGRGITVCDRWLSSFENFLEDMGNAPSKSHSVDRINNNGNYEPSNCRWATKKEQSNNKRNNVFYPFNGSQLTIRQISELTGMPYKLIMNRIKSGLSAEEAVSAGSNRIVSDKNLNSLKVKCRNLGISYSAVRNRAKRKNISFDESVNFFVKKI